MSLIQDSILQNYRARLREYRIVPTHDEGASSETSVKSMMLNRT